MRITKCMQLADYGSLTAIIKHFTLHNFAKLGNACVYAEGQIEN